MSARLLIGNNFWNRDGFTDSVHALTSVLLALTKRCKRFYSSLSPDAGWSASLAVHAELLVALSRVSRRDEQERLETEDLTQCRRT